MLSSDVNVGKDYNNLGPFNNLLCSRLRVHGILLLFKEFWHCSQTTRTYLKIKIRTPYSDKVFP